MFSSMVMHGAVSSDDFSVSTMVPIPKYKTAGITSSSNYRAITMSSILLNFLIVLY